MAGPPVGGRVGWVCVRGVWALALQVGLSLGAAPCGECPVLLGCGQCSRACGVRVVWLTCIPVVHSLLGSPG